jgi:DHA2 family methylenomycin A resistance protein-like MFS transporter
VEPALLREPAFAAANLAGAGVFFALIGATVFFSAFFQQIQGRGPLETGFCMLPLGLAVIVCAPVSGRLTGRIGPRLPLLAGLTAACVATLGMLRLEPGIGFGSVWWNVALIGVGAGTALPAMTVTAVGTVEAARAGMASAIHNASRQIGQVLGVAVLGAIIAARAGAAADGGRRLTGAAAEDWVGGLHVALVVAAALLLAIALAVAALVPPGPLADPEAVA